MSNYAEILKELFSNRKSTGASNILNLQRRPMANEFDVGTPFSGIADALTAYQSGASQDAERGVRDSAILGMAQVDPALAKLFAINEVGGKDFASLFSTLAKKEDKMNPLDLELGKKDVKALEDNLRHVSEIKAFKNTQLPNIIKAIKDFARNKPSKTEILLGEKSEFLKKPQHSAIDSAFRELLNFFGKYSNVSSRLMDTAKELQSVLSAYGGGNLYNLKEAEVIAKITELLNQNILAASDLARVSTNSLKQKGVNVSEQEKLLDNSSLETDNFEIKRVK